MITHTDSDELDNELFKFWQFWPDHAVWVKRIYLMYLAFCTKTYAILRSKTSCIRLIRAGAPCDNCLGASGSL